MALNEWPRMLSLSGEAQTGKTHALIAIARAACADGDVVYLSGWPGLRLRRRLLRAAGLPAEVICLERLDSRASGIRPRTVLVDEASHLPPGGLEAIVAWCRTTGALFLVTAG